MAKRRLFTCLAFAAFGGALSGAATAGDLEESPAVPSGHALYLQEIVFENRQDGSDVARFRWVMPILLQEAMTYANVADDFEYLCNAHAVASLAEQDKSVDQVIVSLSDRETEFGVPSAVAKQFFEAYRVENGACIWEAF